MKLATNDIGTDMLSAFGVEAVELLGRGEFSVLADRFGYAQAFERELEAAIREDLAAHSLN